MNLLPTSDIFNVSNIESMKTTELKDLLVKLAQNATNQNIAINSKVSGIYTTLEDVTGSMYGIGTGTSLTAQVNVPKGSFNKLVVFGTLPTASATKSVAHGIPFTETYKIIKIYGGSTNPTTKSYIPLPFPHPTAAKIISLEADATNVIVTTGATDYSAWEHTFVIIEYVKY